MTFERSSDYALLNSLLRNPKIYRHLGDDFAGPIEEAALPEHPLLWYIVARDEGQAFAAWLFDQRNAISWEFHTIAPLDGRCLRAARQLLGPGGWLWANTPCLRATTYFPRSNKIAARCAARAGLKEYGVNPRSYLLDGELQDQILMGISKE